MMNKKLEKILTETSDCLLPQLTALLRSKKRGVSFREAIISEPANTLASLVVQGLYTGCVAVFAAATFENPELIATTGPFFFAIQYAVGKPAMEWGEIAEQRASYQVNEYRP